MAQKTSSRNNETPVDLTDRIRELNNRFTREEIETGIVITNRQAPEGAHTAGNFEEAYTEALITRTIGEMFRTIRQAEGSSLSGAADRLGVSKGRVAQIEKADANLRMTTLQQTAKSYGYKVQVTLVPEDDSKQPIMAELPT